MSFKVNAIIEMPSGTSYKYEVDKDIDRLRLDRVLSEYIPYSYGYIPNTLQKDGDPLDIFVISDEALVPLSVVRAEVVGIIKCLDSGVEDDKVVSVLDGLNAALYPEAIEAIINYLKKYKAGFEVLEFQDVDKALEIYQLSQVWSNPTT